MVGSLILFDSEAPGFELRWPLVAGLATGGGLVILGIVYQAARSRMRARGHHELRQLGAAVQEPEIRAEALPFCDEMTRARHNIEVIVEGLIKDGYGPLFLCHMGVGVG